VSTRDIRTEVIAAWERVLELNGVPRSKCHAVALELAAVTKTHGVSLTRPTFTDEPVANEWQLPPEQRPAPTTETTDWAVLARANIRHTQEGH
jgi:hypothetical protein